MIGPIGDKNILAYESASLESEVQSMARKTGLSTTYISKLINLTKKLDTDLVDSKKLAELLKVTERSARRILKKLVDAGYAVVATSSQQNAVGRPLLIYKISIF